MTSGLCLQLHDDDEHTLDYAMETVEGVLRREVAGRQGLVRRAKVQWVAYQGSSALCAPVFAVFAVCVCLCVRV